MKGKNKLVPRLLGITKESVMRVDEKTKDVVQEWPLTTVKRWAASPKSFTLVHTPPAAQFGCASHIQPVQHKHHPTSDSGVFQHAKQLFFPDLITQAGGGMCTVSIYYLSEGFFTSLCQPRATVPSIFLPHLKRECLWVIDGLCNIKIYLGCWSTLTCLFL